MSVNVVQIANEACEHAAVQTPRMFIGILTYNGLHHTQRCVDSLIAHTQAPWTALILDNASSDATPAYLHSLSDERISVHCGAENRGVGGGRNWLLEQLAPELGDNDLIVLLDNDIEVAAGWEEPFLNAFAARADLGVAGRWAFSMLVHDSWRDILPEDSADSGPVDTVQGCCFWIRAAAARDVGLFDESLGRFWHEDDDYCIRALVAGWDVRRVWTDRITHHEHGSGVALNPDKVAGSLRNQAYLVQKWRELGAIDSAGVPVRPRSDVDSATLHELSQQVGRPLLRTELNSAMMSVTRMLHSDLSDAELAALATPVAKLLLRGMSAAGGDTGMLASLVASRLHSVLASRRASAPTAAAAARAFSGVCNPGAWDDARWASVYESVFRDGSGRDYSSRTEAAWRDGQLYGALRTLGVLRRGARVLFVGHAGERLISPLMQHAAHMHVADTEQIAGAQLTQLSATRSGAATVETGLWPTQSLNGRFDVVVCANIGRIAAAADVTALLTALAGCARPGGTVACAASVRIAGPADGRWVESSLFDDADRLAAHGLNRVGAFDGQVSDELLLRAVPARSSLTLRPGLSRLIAPHIVTLATLVARVR